MKKLDISFFDGEPSAYRWAAVDSDGSVTLFKRRPELDRIGGCWIDALGEMRGVGAADPKDWQESLLCVDSAQVPGMLECAEGLTPRQLVALEFVKLYGAPNTRDELQESLENAFSAADIFLEVSNGR